MTFKQWLQISSIFAFLLFDFIWAVMACGWYPDESDFLRFMSPEIVQQPKAQHLAFDPSSQFYWQFIQGDIARDSLSDKQLNIISWQQFVGKEVPAEDIELVIYAFPYEKLHDCLGSLERNKKWPVPELWKNNQMVNWLMQKKNREALRYLVLAKKAEPLSVKEYDPWNPVPTDTALANTCLRLSAIAFQKTKIPFLKARYAFQLVKNAFYGEKYGLCEEHFVNYAMPVEGIDPYLDTRMTAYRAGALYKNDKKAEAAYCFAMLFYKTQNIDIAYQHSLGFIWSERETPLNNVLAYCGTNKHEQSVIYALYGMRQTEPYQIMFMDSCFRNNPNNELLDVLLMREINKAEWAHLQLRADLERGYYVYDGWTGGPVYGLSEDRQKSSSSFFEEGAPANLKRLHQFVHRLTQEETLKQKVLWHMADGYLAYMVSDFAAARKALQLADKQAHRVEIKNELMVLKLLCDLREDKIALPFFYDELATQLSLIEGVATSDTSGKFKAIFQNILRSELPLYFKRRKDTIRELLCYQRYETIWFDEENNTAELHFSDYYFRHTGALLDKYFSQNQLNDFLVFQHNPSSRLDKWLLTSNKYNDRIIRELQGVKYFRNFEYDKALNILKGQDTSQTVPDIFKMYVNDYQEVPVEDLEQTYTTEAVLEQLITLKQKAPSDPKSAYRYACILYSLSYHGRCHKAWNFYRNSTDEKPYYFNKDNHYTPFEIQYFYADEAYTWFKKAYLSSSDELIKQNALWMMAKCEQKRCPLSDESQPYWNEKDAEDYVSWSVNKNVWLAQFDKQFRGTPFYNQVYEECAYLQLFAAKQK